MDSPTTSEPVQQPRFLFIACQVGAEGAVKGEIGQHRPEFRLAFSRPGFLTFKLPEHQYLAPDFDLESIFARAYGFSLGKIAAASTGAAAAEVWRLLGDRPVCRVHVWQRDRSEPGEHGFEPSVTAAATAAYDAVRTACPFPQRLADGNHLHDAAAAPGDWIADVILVDDDQWWVGFHRARSMASRWPGGLPSLSLPPTAVSRAWLKMEEALRWSQIPATAGARFAEIGSAPGGSSQALLARGFQVVGIDPAEMAPEVLEHPHFRHIRRRAAQVPRRAFRKIRWLTADMNVAPGYTLDAVEEIVKHPEVNIRGMLLTLKLPEWHLAGEVSSYLARISSWGFNQVRARQLAYNRREICVAALQKPFQRKPPLPRHE